MSRIRLRVLAYVLGLTLTAVGLISLAALPAIPVIGVAFAAAAFGVNSLTSRLRMPVCHGCGQVLGDAPAGLYGVVCPHCGSLTQIGEHPHMAADIETDADESRA